MKLELNKEQIESVINELDAMSIYSHGEVWYNFFDGNGEMHITIYVTVFPKEGYINIVKTSNYDKAEEKDAELIYDIEIDINKHLELLNYMKIRSL